ncbi:MAG: hypothetical protein H7282_08250 [Cytophagaceae bacterium]|nr:hypothetical protein [Cytophagaceae bacterium]
MNPGRTGCRIKRNNIEIKAHGKLMVKDQNRLYAIMKTLAVHRKIQLPVVMSGEKQDGLKDLLAK